MSENDQAKPETGEVEDKASLYLSARQSGAEDEKINETKKNEEKSVAPLSSDKPEQHQHHHQQQQQEQHHHRTRKHSSGKAEVDNHEMRVSQVSSDGCKIMHMPQIEYQKSESMCDVKPALDCEGPLWRLYMTKFAEDLSERMAREKEECLGPDCRPKRYYPRLPCPRPPADNDDPYCCYKLNGFNVSEWKKLKESVQKEPSAESVTAPCDWPRIPPCGIRDFIREKKIEKRKQKMAEAGATQCEIDAINSPDDSEEDELEELAKMKELNHARVPITELKKGEDKMLVDRCCGPSTGLVFGDYIVVELKSSEASRSIAYVTLHGLKGMHIAELEREFETAWKFDMYQAMVALLAKTQFVYRHVWSPNIDYIYEKAWYIFVHVGFLNADQNLRFDDVLIYNYRYSVELEMVDEYKDAYVTPDIPFKFFEANMVRVSTRHRKELTLSDSHFGEDKEKDSYTCPVHRLTKNIERWFDNVDPKYTNCILKTPRFAVAYWEDGKFWYLYNPYRCDKLGFFSWDGYACLSKHCSKEALKRHLMILILRAYAYSSTSKKPKNDSEDQKSNKSKKSRGSSIKTEQDSNEIKTFSIRIYQFVYHSCNIHNVKLLTKKPREEAKKGEEPLVDHYTHLGAVNCEDFDDKEITEDMFDKLENPKWLKTKKILWIKKATKKPVCPPGCSDKPEDTPAKQSPGCGKWHNFEILKPQHLFVMWGDIHITDSMFPIQNRYHQAEACYAVCAGMVRVNVPEYWTGETLNAIVVCGDRFYTNRKKKATDPCEPDPVDKPYEDPENLEWDARPMDKFQISGFDFVIQVLPEIKGRLYTKSDSCLWRSLETMFLSHNFGIFNCESARLGVFKQYGAYYILDVRSYGPPIYEIGTAGTYLLRAASFLDFITSLVLIVAEPECSSFSIRPVDIVKCIDMGEEDSCGRPRCPDPGKCGPERDPQPKCPKDHPCAKKPKCAKKPPPKKPSKCCP